MVGELDSGLVELAPAKLTKSLEIIGVREDGYHLIRSEMVSVSLYDEILISDEENSVEIVDPYGYVSQLEAIFGEIPRGDGNLALQALKMGHSSLSLRIVKRIPFGAGLGGGSSDAAAVLRLLGLHDDVTRAISLGADVPFCLRGGRALVTGVGEQVTPIDYVSESFILFFLPICVSTKAVYEAFDRVGPGTYSNHLQFAAMEISEPLRSYYWLVSRRLGRELEMAGSGSTFFLSSESDDFAKVVQELGVRSGTMTPLDLGNGLVSWSTLVNSVRGR